MPVTAAAVLRCDMICQQRGKDALQVIELWQRKGTGAGADNFFVKALVNGEEVQLEGASPGTNCASASTPKRLHNKPSLGLFWHPAAQTWGPSGSGMVIVNAESGLRPGAVRLSKNLGYVNGSKPCMQCVLGTPDHENPVPGIAWASRRTGRG